MVKDRGLLRGLGCFRRVWSDRPEGQPQTPNQKPFPVEVWKGRAPLALEGRDRQESIQGSGSDYEEWSEDKQKRSRVKREGAGYLNRDILIQRGKSEQAPRSLSSGRSCIQSHAKRRDQKRGSPNLWKPNTMHPYTQRLNISNVSQSAKSLQGSFSSTFPEACQSFGALCKEKFQCLSSLVPGFRRGSTTSKAHPRRTTKRRNRGAVVWFPASRVLLSLPACASTACALAPLRGDCKVGV